MKIFHFTEFDSRFNNESLSVINEELKFIKEEKKIDFKCFSKEATEVLDEYLLFSRDTLEVKFGLTVQYWMGYFEILHLYHEFSKGIRTGDLDFYIHCLPKITNYLFAFNHHNYVRWLVLFHGNLLKLKIIHPEVHKKFKNGCFSLKRTKKPFSRLPVDLTLEQTINADAASQKKGISAITNSTSARQRWAESHYIRISIVSHLFEELNLTKKEDVSRDLKSNRIKRIRGAFGDTNFNHHKNDESVLKRFK